MKKIFTLVAMATISLAASAQTESAWVDATLGSADGTAQPAGTVVASSASVDMKLAFDNSLKAVAMTGESDAVNQVVIDGVTYAVNENQGVQEASTNPTPSNIGAATDGYWVGGPNTGGVFRFDVKKDGYLCVFGKLTATKQYAAWEGDIANAMGTLVAYRLVGQGVKAANGSVNYTLPAEDGDNLASEALMSANAEKYYKNGSGTSGIAAANIIDPNFAEGNALGVMILPVYAEAGEYYVHGFGTKWTSNGFVFIPGDAPTAAGAAAISVSFSSTTAVAGISEAKAEAKAPVKVITANGVQIGNYNIAGQQVK